MESIIEKEIDDTIISLCETIKDNKYCTYRQYARKH